MTTYLLDAASVNPTAAKYLSLCHLGTVDRASSMVEAEKRRTYENVENHPLNKHIFFAIELTGRLGKAASSFLKESGLSDKRQRQLKNDLAAIVAFSNGECIAAINSQGSTHPSSDDTDDLPLEGNHTHNGKSWDANRHAAPNPYFTHQQPSHVRPMAPTSPDMGPNGGTSQIIHLKSSNSSWSSPPTTPTTGPPSPSKTPINASSQPRKSTQTRTRGQHHSPILPNSGITSDQIPPSPLPSPLATTTPIPTSGPNYALSHPPNPTQAHLGCQDSSPTTLNLGITKAQTRPIPPSPTRHTSPGRKGAYSPTPIHLDNTENASSPSQSTRKSPLVDRTTTLKYQEQGIKEPRPTSSLPSLSTMRLSSFFYPVQLKTHHTQSDAPRFGPHREGTATDKALCRDIVGWDNTSVNPSLAMISRSSPDEGQPPTPSNMYSPMAQHQALSRLSTPMRGNNSDSFRNLIGQLEDMLSTTDADLEEERERPI